MIFMYKKCKLCGKEFKLKSNAQKYCSEECSLIAYKRHQGQAHYHSYLTDDIVNYVLTDSYDITQLPWMDREKEAPGYTKAVVKMYNDANFLCEITKAPNVVVHHLNSYHWDVSGRCDANNMIVINKTIHEFFHFLYGWSDNTIEQFNDFLNLHFGISMDIILKNRGVWVCN